MRAVDGAVGQDLQVVTRAAIQLTPTQNTPVNRGRDIAGFPFVFGIIITIIGAAHLNRRRFGRAGSGGGVGLGEGASFRHQF